MTPEVLPVVLPVVLAVAAGSGAYFLYTALALGQTDVFNRVRTGPSFDSRINDWLAQSGLGGVDRRELFAVVGGLTATGALGGWMLFGSLVAAVVLGGFAATFPIATYQQRRRHRQAEAAEAWPRLIEEIRLRCGSLGRPIPQALLEVGRGGPPELRDAFAEAEREWLISTDFPRTVAVLKERLADPTADATCETLLVAHTVGGTDLDKRLAALAADRHADLQGRKDAKAKQAGIRFARRFVLLVPFGMAFAGLSIGNGRSAYQTPTGQLAVVFALSCLIGCWVWAGAMIRIPQEQRVFRD